MRLSHVERQPTDDLVKKIQISDRAAFRSCSVRMDKSAFGRMRASGSAPEFVDFVSAPSSGAVFPAN
jgi:hypothetical protein